MTRLVTACASGSLFGAGLAISGMADPKRVRGFLDAFGEWDITLAFVMAGALLPMTIAWFLQRRLSKPLVDSDFSLPATRRIYLSLALGAILFGIGWGIAGLCPGPAIAGLVIAPAPAATFVIAMLAGMAVHRLVTK